MVRTFLDVFPCNRAVVRRLLSRPSRGRAVRRLASGPVDLARVDDRVASAPRLGRARLLSCAAGLAMLHFAALDQVPDLFARTSRNTDDRPVIEFLAPRLTRMDARGDRTGFTGASLATFYDALAPRTATGRDPFLPSALDVAAPGVPDRALSLLARRARHDAATSDAREAEVRARRAGVILTAEATAVGADDPAGTRRRRR